MDTWRNTSELEDSPEVEESLPLYEQEYETPPVLPEAVVNPNASVAFPPENTLRDPEDIVHSEQESVHSEVSEAEDNDAPATEVMAPQAVRDAQQAADRHKAAFEVALAQYDRAKSVQTPHHRTVLTALKQMEAELKAIENVIYGWIALYKADEHQATRDQLATDWLTFKEKAEDHLKKGHDFHSKLPNAVVPQDPQANADVEAAKISAQEKKVSTYRQQITDEIADVSQGLQEDTQPGQMEPRPSSTGLKASSTLAGSVPSGT